MMLSCDSSRLDTETFQEKSVRLLPRLIAAYDRAISGRLNMLVKQNLLLISNRYSMWMTLYRAKAIESNYVIMQVKGAVYKGMS